MKNVLLLTSSPRGAASLSTQIATELAQQISGAQITTRELWREPVPHIDPDFVEAVYVPEHARTPNQVEELVLSNTLLEELQNAEIVIIGAGMINFSLPSTLKAWLDHIVRAGVTFKYGAAGPEGLVKGKKVVLVLASGGVYSSGPMTQFNHLEPYLRAALGFIGMTDVETIAIEGVAMGPEAVESAVASAKEKAATLAASYGA